MLRIYQGRETIDKEKFIYEQLEGETLVIVPDQYTLIAEEQAMHYLKTACLLNVEILGMNRLGLKMLQEQGVENVRVLDQYERFMILARIIRKHRERLEVFRLSSDKRDFVDMVNDFISDFKQQDCRMEDLQEIIQDPGTDELLRKKLTEIAEILEEYESLIQGKYKDVADYAEFYTQAMAKSQALRSKNVWVYGFDSLTPKFTDTLMTLAGVAQSVSVMVNCSDFGLDEIMTGSLYREAEARGIPVSAESLQEPVMERSETIRRMEKDLFSNYSGTSKENSEFDPKDLTLVECSTMYSEAESAAVYIYGLLHQGYSMKDISIICNDTEVMQPIVERTFREYGLPLFRDARRSVRDSQAVGFVMSLLDICVNGYRRNTLMTLLKSGLAGMDEERIWNLENYAVNYDIKGSMWGKPFRYGSFEYDPEEFAQLEESRIEAIQPIQELLNLTKETETVGDFVEGFYNYLNDTWHFLEQIQSIQQEQSDRGLLEEAQWTVQCCNAVVHILECVRNLMGEEPLDMKEFLELYSVGILNTEVGMIPPAQDGLSIGTMIRSRIAAPRAVVVLSATEGTLPATPGDGGLFSVDEKTLFRNHDFPLGRLDDLQLLEENAAMYRMVSQPTEKLYVSYSMSDGEGADKKPSTLVQALRDLFPKLKVQKDVLSQGFNQNLVQSPAEAIRHMMNHYKERPADQMLETVQEQMKTASMGSEKSETDGAGMEQMGTEKEEPFSEDDYLAEGVLRWYEKHQPVKLKELTQAGLNENEAEPLSRDTAKRLYNRGGDFVFSASKLEQFNHCPFKHFVLHGLKAEEQREFHSTGREIGDVYHECIMRVSRRLVEQGILNEDEKVGSPADSSYGGVSAETLAEMVDQELSGLSDTYRGGLFVMNGREKYRMDRIREICLEAVQMLAEQLRLGQIELAFFEEKFGRGCRFEPIEYSLHGEKVYIEGKIDRADVMKGGELRIIDYKTGNDKLDVDQMRAGYKMQLMVYLDGACGKEFEPVGMFYLNIKDHVTPIKTEDAEQTSKKALSEREKQFKLNGLVVDDPEVLAKMPEEMLKISSKKSRMNRESFDELRQDVHKMIEKMSDGILQGVIEISPAKAKPTADPACRFCQYRAICKFDITYRKNSYRIL